MLKEKVREITDYINAISHQIIIQKELLRNNKANLSYANLREQRELCEENYEISKYKIKPDQKKSQLISKKNRVTMMAIQETDPKLFNLIKRYQAAEQINLNYLAQFEQSESAKRNHINEYNNITQLFLTDEKIKSRLKCVAGEASGKEVKISGLRDKLGSLRQQLMSPGYDFEEIKNLMQLYEELLQEKLDISEENSRLCYEIDEINMEIREIKETPRRMSTGSRLQKEIKVIKERINPLSFVAI